MSNPKAMNRIKTWRERCEEHRDHDGIVSDGMIMALMQEEIGELRAALEQADQAQPVAWMCSDASLMQRGYSRFSRNCEGAWNIPVYTTPPQRNPLTDEEIAKIASTPCAVVGSYVHTFARAVEAAHGIKGEA